jgi:hypothetical protein
MVVAEDISVATQKNERIITLSMKFYLRSAKYLIKSSVTN